MRRDGAERSLPREKRQDATLREGGLQAPAAYRVGRFPVRAREAQPVQRSLSPLPLGAALSKTRDAEAPAGGDPVSIATDSA